MIPAWLFLAAGVALPPMPPDAPDKTETIISGVGDAVASRCSAAEAVRGKRLKTTQLKVVVTKSPKWGTIWRQDVAFPVDHPGDQPIIFRTICSKDVEVVRPLRCLTPKRASAP